MHTPRIKSTPLIRLVASIATMSLVGVVLLIARVIDSDSMRYVFLVWNLILAAVAPLLAWWLVLRVRKFGWLHWQQLLLATGWLVFLPNSFYVITDFIHLRSTYEASLIYDIVMLTSFSISSLILGYISVFMVHRELQKRLRIRHAWAIIAGIFFVASFAITLGRFTRWNSWDILLKPAGLLFDVSDRVINPAAHTGTYVATIIFFALLLSTYWVVWETYHFARAK